MRIAEYDILPTFKMRNSLRSFSAFYIYFSNTYTSVINAKNFSVYAPQAVLIFAVLCTIIRLQQVWINTAVFNIIFVVL